MSGTKKAFDLSKEFLETFLSTISKENEKKIVRQIVNRFVDCGLPVKTKQYDQPCMEGTYRILCFVKKSAEAVIINNKGMGHDSMSIQVRIENKSTFEKLNVFNDKVRNRILNANDCKYCSTKCEKNRYNFTFGGKKYVKCQYLCSNFIFKINRRLMYYD